MRRTFNDKQFIIENNILLGVCLGYDHCAEHEWGIKGIQRKFGLNGSNDMSKFGIEKRIITKIPENLHFTNYTSNKNKMSGLLFTNLWGDEKPSKYLKKNVEIGGGISAAWDESSFGIVTDKENSKYLEEIYEAIQKKDVTISLKGNWNPFGGSGLCIMIASRLPKEVIQKVYDSDKDYYNLQETSKLTGIYNKLAEAGKKYFARSPRWKKNMNGDFETKYDVVFWLNPQEQHKNNSGWYTVEDLEMWIEGKGPIPI